MAAVPGRGASSSAARVGLLAAALLAVSFLAVFYSHLALNDVPTLAPIALSLWGTAGVLREGRLRDYLLAGRRARAGLRDEVHRRDRAAAAAWRPARIRLARRGGARRRPRAASCSPASSRWPPSSSPTPTRCSTSRPSATACSHQADAADDALGKLGLTQSSGHLYYLWTFTWGLGWVPLVAARRRRSACSPSTTAALLLVLGPAPILYVLFMGTQARFFGRWLLPVFPIACLLAAYAIVRARPARRRGARPRSAPALAVLGAVLLLGQGIVYSLHSAMTLSRADTRNQARAWLVDHVPANTKIVVEPVVPDAWASDIGHPNPGTANGARWSKFPTSRSNIANDGSVHPGARADRQHRGLRAHALSRA